MVAVAAETRAVTKPKRPQGATDRMKRPARFRKHTAGELDSKLARLAGSLEVFVQS